MSLHVGETFGDYRVVSLVGAGAMGQVFQVEHRLTKRVDAAKVLSAEAATEIQIQRFERELAVHARLNHPNIAAVHNALRVDDRLILIMEFVEGQTLESLLQNSRIPVETGLQYIRQTLAALEYAHQQGVVHRDVNPANLIVTPAGTVKLTDFGVAKRFGDSQLTNWGDLVGSVRYLAPEQAKGSVDPDPRSDLFAVGAILYELLTGKSPYGDNRVVALLTDAEQPPTPPTEIDRTLAPQSNEIVFKALARDPRERYQSAVEFASALEQIERLHGPADPFAMFVELMQRLRSLASPVAKLAESVQRLRGPASPVAKLAESMRRLRGLAGPVAKLAESMRRLRSTVSPVAKLELWRQISTRTWKGLAMASLFVVTIVAAVISARPLPPIPPPAPLTFSITPPPDALTVPIEPQESALVKSESPERKPLPNKMKMAARPHRIQAPRVAKTTTDDVQIQPSVPPVMPVVPPVSKTLPPVSQTAPALSHTDSPVSRTDASSAPVAIESSPAPAASDLLASKPTEPVAQPKKGFWNKINPFKRKKNKTAEDQTDQQ